MQIVLRRALMNVRHRCVVRSRGCSCSARSCLEGVFSSEAVGSLRSVLVHVLLIVSLVASIHHDGVIVLLSDRGVVVRHLIL